MRWGTLERVPQTPQNFSKTGLRLPGIGTDARFRDFSCSLPLPYRPDTRGRACPAGHLLHRLRQCRFRLSPGDARGEAPCIRKLKIPLPRRGRGSGGWGQKSKPKAGLAGDKEGTSPAGQRQGQSARRRTLSRVPRRIPVPAGHLLRGFSQCRFRLSPGDARGEAPCIRKLKIPPFPGGEGGWGDGGRKASQKQGWQATRKARPPPGTCSAGSANAASGSAPGMQGAKPLA